ncbi:MAG: chemotaxis response regulator protein-glutamate methylesterase [Planctomycetota bacterium]|nr:chemotaxis response regulator protein-glutamate methylesterase [Planctomycetota bacterium]
MQPIKVLVVDDSVVIRRLLTAVLDADPRIEVVGYSTNGKLALRKIEQLEPEVVTLDVMMPVMDGIECMREIRKRWKDLPVIMFSSLTEEGAAVTLEALEAGANDFVTKPWHTDGYAASVNQVSDALIQRIVAFHRPRDAKVQSRSTAPQGAVRAALPTPTRPRVGNRAVTAIVIGASTGGPNALNELFSVLPADLGVPILITQHMPPMFTTMLAERLDKLSDLHVREASDGDLVLPGQALLAPGDFHMRFKRAGTSILVALEQDEPVHSCRPAVDPMFASAREVWGPGLLAVVLTGMGQDGAKEAARIVEAGGQVLAQDEASSVIWGMPGAVALAGTADAVLPLDELASEIAQRVCDSSGRLTGGGAR